jgi:predicted  nucleic acid-binding Zn-ribbon protein
MKKSIVTLGILALFLAISFTSCKDAETIVKDTQEEVLDARVDLMETKNEATEALKTFKLDVYKQLSDNNKKVRDLRVKEIEGTSKEKNDYTTRIDALQTKNEALKSKLDAYTTYDAASYDTFKNNLQENAAALEREFQELENQK